MDVNDRPRVEEALRESEERYRTLAEAAADMIFVIDRDYCVTYINTSGARQFGAAPAVLIGRPVDSLFPPETVEQTKQALRRVFDTGQRERDDTLVRIGGRESWLSTELVPIRADSGMVSSVMGFSRDITDRVRAEELLRSERDFSRAALDSLPGLFYLFDQHGRFLRVNKNFEAVSGYSAEQLAGVTPLDFFGQADKPRVAAAIARVFETGEASVEAAFLSRNLAATPCVFTGQRFWDGQTRCVIGMGIDITERKRTEDELRRTRDRAQGYLDTVETMIVALDAEGRISAINRKGCQVLGWTEQELLGQFWFGICLPQPEGMEVVYPIFQSLMAGSAAAEHAENEVVTKGHGRRQIAWHNAVLRDDEGRVIGTLSSGNDVTERRQAEAALRDSEERLSLVLDGSQLGFWDWDVETGVVQRNRRWAEMLGYSLEEVEVNVRQWSDLVHPDDRAAAGASIQDHLDGRTPMHRFEYRLRAKDGRYRWILDQARVVRRASDGTPLRMAGTHTDITELKRAEEEKAELEAQLQQAQKLEAVGRLAGGVAHDFNNMLGVILGHAEMAMEQVDPSLPLHADLDVIHAAARRSADLTRQLLAFARRQVVLPKVLDLNVVVGNAVKMLQRLIGEQISLEWRPGAGLWPVKVDPSQLDQILTNLCVNARDAIAGTGAIVIESGRVILSRHQCEEIPDAVPGEYVRLAVSDSGCGMDADMLARIFEPFFTTKSVGEGTGLGLSTVYGAVRQNGGAIRVQSARGVGTTFTVYLPRHVGAVDKPGAEGAARIEAGGHETVLVVEDEPSLLRLVATQLRRAGYRVLAANTPAEAMGLATSSQGDIDLLITDVVMPQQDGRALSAELRSRHPRLKCLFMSGYTADIIAHHGLLDEGVSFIQKPFPAAALAAKVRDVLGRA